MMGIGLCRTHAPAMCTSQRFAAMCAGGHLNPAVSLGMLVARKISVVRFVLYVGIQMAGACTGAGLAKAVRAASRGHA